MDESPQEWEGPQIEQGDRVYVCKHPAQMNDANARVLGFVARTSGATCDIVSFPGGGSRVWLGCRHIDDPGALKKTLFEDPHYGLYKLADSEEKLRQAMRKSERAIAACAEFAAMLSRREVPVERREVPVESAGPETPAKRPRGRPRKPVEASSAG